jgi:xylanolytic transcriptional activator XlnR
MFSCCDSQCHITRTVRLIVYRIIGEILDYHFLRQHPTFDLDSGLLETIREKIQANLTLWFDSLRAHLPPDFCDSVNRSNNTNPTISACPTLAYYGLHLYHCMHVLLYGQLDVVRMYEDVEWQASPDFIKAGEHAMACANVSHPSILRT